jgi:hypothetical protein
MTCSAEDCGKIRRPGAEGWGWSHRSGTRWPGDREVRWRCVRSTPCTWRCEAWVSWLRLKTKGDSFLRFVLKTSGDDFLRFFLKTGGDGFLRFGLKASDDGFSLFGLKTGGLGFSVWPSKPAATIW